MSERPIERLNYFNGQRLDAEDLRLEQEYHINIQRWLMKTLFSPGVARGFEIHVLDGGTKIRLDPGLALDDLGRAIILVAPVELTPQARLLCIRYAERKERQQDGSCAVNGLGTGAVLASWGGPERILSRPDIFWRADPPMQDTRELIIGELTLRANCTVEKVAAGPRHRASPLPVQQVHQVSFEGEKDIDDKNPKVIHFFIRGGRPNAVTLYLRAKKFSSLHYSEVGQITPAITGYGPGDAIQTDSPSGVDAHSHDGSSLSARPENSAHPHDVMSRVFNPSTNTGGPDKGIFVTTGGTTNPPPFPLGIGGLGFRDISPSAVSLVDLDPANLRFSVAGGEHTHGISGKTATVPQDAAPAHTHPIRVKVSTTGAGPGTAVRNGPQLLYLKGLTISVGKAGSNPLPCTEKILRTLEEKSEWGIQSAFNGSPGDPLYKYGTGLIRLDLIDGLSFEPDEFHPYEITLSVQGSGNGGCIQYNLYVE